MSIGPDGEQPDGDPHGECALEIARLNAELVLLRANNERMSDLLDRRPAMNTGLVSTYSSWTSLVYASDAAFAQSHIPPKVSPLQ